MRNRILVTGANGQLGSELRAIHKKYDNSIFLFTDVEELDILDFESVNKFVKDNQISVIINCAAYTAVDKAEDEIELAEKINIEGPKNLAKAAKNNNIKLIHISTDYVFNGNSYLPYTEEMKTAPLGVYGKTKLEGENEALEIYPKTIIIRTSWLYSSFGNNFVKTMIRLGKQKDKISVICDQIGTPTYARDLAQTIIDVVLSERNIYKNNIFHYSNEGAISWYDFACSIMELAKIDCKVIPIETKDYPTKTKRPFYSVLNKTKMKKVFGIKIPYWRSSLLKCIEEINN